MKKVLSVFLAVMMVAGLFVALIPTASASTKTSLSYADATPEPIKKKVLYTEDFESVDSSLTGKALRDALGWTVSANAYSSEKNTPTGATSKIVETENGNHAIQLFAGGTWANTCILKDERLAGGDYYIEYTQKMISNSKTDGQGLGFVSNGDRSNNTTVHTATAWQMNLKERGEWDTLAYYKDAAGRVDICHSIDYDPSSNPSDNGSSTKGSIVGKEIRIRIVIDADFGMIIYTKEDDRWVMRATMANASTSSTWASKSATIGDEILLRLINGPTIQLDDIEIGTLYGAGESMISMTGYQTTVADQNQRFDLRFVAKASGINDFSTVESVHYEISIAGEAVTGSDTTFVTKNVYLNYVYESITANFGGSMLEADGDEFYTALHINGCSEGVIYKVTPIITLKDDTTIIGKQETYVPTAVKIDPEPELPSGIEENQKIVVEIAKAYDRKGGKIPYDQYYSRRSIYSSPEDATAQRTIFLDCSAFVNSCYREGFGVNVMPYEITEKSPNTVYFDEYARDNGENADVIGYWVPSEYPTSEDKTALVDWIYDNLQIGDILTYRHGKTSATSGHVYIYIGDNTFMHCAGAGSYVYNESNPALSYDSNETEIIDGRITTISSDTIFKNTTHSRYLFKATDTDTVFSFSMIRPFARGLTPTQESLNRMKIAGLSMEKTSSIHENSALLSGSRLTYTITLENTTGNALSNVIISDILPAGTAFVSGDNGVTVSDGNLSWVGDVAANATVSVNYTVEITESTPGALIVSNETYVSGVKLGCITHTVSSLTPEEQALIAQTAINYAANGSAFENAVDMVKAIYASHGIEIFDQDTVDAILDLLIDEEKLTHHTSTALSDMLVPNLYGGRLIRTGWTYLESENDKTRLPKEEHLSVGDIIVADWSGGSVVYFYAGAHKLITVEDGVCKELTIGENIFVEGENILISLLGYDRYAVIRPGMRETATAEIVSIEITNLPNKLNYYNGESFDSTGMVVTATLSDQTKITLTSYVISPVVLTPDVTFVTVTVGGKTATVNVTVSEGEYVYSIGEASELDIGETVTVEGIVVGVAHEGMGNDKELLVKDLSTDTVIAVRNTGGSIGTVFGYQIGDRIKFKATVKKDTSSSACYTLKKYLEYSAENGTKSDTVVSSGNTVSYTFEDAVEIDSQEDMQAFFQKETNFPYTYLKLSGGFYLSTYVATDTTNYRLHKNPNATVSADIKYDGTSVTLRDDVMKINLGTDWKELLSFEEKTTYQGTLVEKDIYVLYIGGNNSYYQLVILDGDWISQAE